MENNKLTSIKLQRKVVTVSEASQMLAMAPLTVRRAIKNRKIKAMQINGRYRIPIDEIDDFVKRNSLDRTFEDPEAPLHLKA